MKPTLPMKGQITMLIRHGSTDNNGEGNIRGWTEGPENQLTEKGKNDAKQAGIELAKSKIKPDILIPSDLKRAIHSAEIVSKESGVPVGKPEKGLRSQDMGIYTGKKEKPLRAMLEKFAFDKPGQKLPGSTESHNDFVNRIKTTLEGIKSKYQGKKIAVVTHHQVERLVDTNFGKEKGKLFNEGVKPGSIVNLKKPVLPV